MSDIICITDGSTPAEIERAICALRAKQNRLPFAWTDRREEIAVELEELVNLRLKASA